MYYLTTLRREVEIQPKDLGPNLRQRIEQKLADEFEDKCDDTVGCIIAIVSFINFSQGRVLMGFGSVSFEVTFQCLCMKPETGEVVDCVVSEVTQSAVIASAGPLKIVISHRNLPEDEGFTLNYADGVRCFVSKDQSTRIQAGTELRVRILGARRTVADYRETFVAMGTLDQDWLGVLGS